MAGGSPDWRAVSAELSARDPASLSAEDLDALAESAFWLDRPDESIAVRGRAFTAHVAAGDHAGAAMAAWQLFYDHALVGEMAPANGWLERARRHAAQAEGTAARGFLAVAESDLASTNGSPAEALAHAERAVEAGQAAGDPDLLAMALQAKGRALVACGRSTEGMAALDEAMVAVVNGELAPLFTGWVYCNALSTCHDLADLSRALQWSEAAMRWCAGLDAGRLYPGICRLHVVELESLRGSWRRAAEQARRACDELTSHDSRYAGGAHYLIGELHRVTGRLDLAEEAFTRAHQLGHLPQPGLARVRMAQGRVDAAITALRLALDAGPTAPLPRSELLMALVEAQVAVADLEAAQATSAELAAVAGGVASDYLSALSLSAEATVLLAWGDGATACRRAGDAAARFRSLGLAYGEAQARAVHGVAARAVADHDTARLELSAALDVFERLGAEPDVHRLRSLLGAEPSSPLSARETEVLRLLARGGTNKQIAAELVVSEHTVARHLSNIYAKLGVVSRAAATSFAYEHALI